MTRFVPAFRTWWAIGLGIMLAARAMAAPDDSWDGRFYANGTEPISGVIYAFAVSGSNVYVGGRFSNIFGVRANNIARWDGSTWSALGSGTGGGGGNAAVYALAVSGGDLYVGGGFTTAGGVSANRIAKWNGTTWSALGSGVSGPVYAIAASGSNVYAGGDFGTAGGSPASRIAQWNGTSWSALGSGMNDTVRALAISGSTLYAGGQFTTAGGASANRIAQWDGAAWSALGSGTNNYVYALTVSGTNLYVGGFFTSAGGVGASHVVRWDGATWSALGSGTNNSAVHALAVAGGDLYAMGDFTSPGTFIARWNGATWSALGTGLGTINAGGGLAGSGSDLYVGGQFVGAGGLAATSVAHWNGSAWSLLTNTPGVGIASSGFYPGVRALAYSGSGDLYAGGVFDYAGTTPAISIAKFDGTGWSALGSLEGPSFANYFHGFAQALAFYGGELIVAGHFATAGGVTANHIARWNGTSFAALGSGITVGQNVVNALAVYNGELYAGGSFSSAGGVSVSNIARWNGTSWSALGSGTSGPVRALLVVGSDLYVGGDFSMAGGVSAGYVARWDGANWSAVGSGTGSGVNALAASGSDLYAGGSFPNGSGIMKWDGATWSIPGGGICTFCGFGGHYVAALAAVGSDIYVGGPFDFVGSGGSQVTASGIAKWNGTSWSALGSGLGGGASVFAVAGADLYVGGQFTVAGEKPASYISLWHTCGNGVSDSGEQCDDGNITNGDCCSSTCQAETPGNPCPDDGNVCTNDVCNGSGSCSHPNNTSPCDDGLFCNGADVCSGGSCTHGPNPCSGGPQCNQTCNEAADNCFDPPTTACATDGNVCTDDHCDGAGACVYTNNSASCDDGLFCNGADVCAGGICTHGVNPCSGGPQCNQTCNEATDDCFDPPTTACASDGNVCTDDQCDGAGACINTNNNAPCDDGNGCTDNDACVGGSCIGSPFICGNGTVEGSCGEQCDDGGNGNGCDASCQLDTVGRACKRAIGLRARLLVAKDLTLIQLCLERVAAGKLGCQGNQCVLNPASLTPVTVSGSSCTVAADCCPAFDSGKITATTSAKMTTAATAAAKAVKKACSLYNGADAIKGTDDDSFVDPQTLGFGATCLEVAGACGSMATTLLVNPGSDNDLIECTACMAATAATEVLGFHYPLQGSSAAEVTCQRAVGLQARRLAAQEATLLQLCLDRVANHKLVCQSGQCVLNPSSMTPVTVPGSSCTVDADCCPQFDNAVATKSTQAKLATYGAGVAKAIKKGCSVANGVDGLKGTDDDTFVDPQNLGYGGTCPAVLGQCGAIATTEMVAAGAPDDLVECVACTQSTAGAGLANFHAPPAD